MWMSSLGDAVLLRRISEHIKNQDWFTVWVEIAIVFLGVFIGLQADNWNDERIAKADAKIYYARLIKDLYAEESTRLAQIAYYQRTKRHGEAALAAIQQSDSELGEQFLIDIYQASQIWNYTTQRTTYDELVAGRIANTIPDADVRSRLANYYVALESAEMAQRERTPFRNNIRAYMPHSVQSRMRESCGDKITSQKDNVVQLALPERCELTLDPLTISEAVSALNAYSSMENDLTRHLADVEMKLLSLEAYLMPTRELAKYLEEVSR
jgi:hypothetical protein